MTPAVRRICFSVFPPPVMGKAVGALRKMIISPAPFLWEGAERFLMKGNADVVNIGDLFALVRGVNCPAGIRVEGFGFSRLRYRQGSFAHGAFYDTLF